MFRGFYTVGSGMIAQQRRTEMLSNNIANANTPGYKAEQSAIRAFPEMFMSRLDAMRVPTEKGLHFKGLSPVGELSTGVYMQETLPQFAQGQLRETELKTDVALVDGPMDINEETGIAGTVFFTLEGENGDPYYTRNGNFTVNAEGFLTNPMGLFVLDTAGNRIELPSDDIRITQEGVIFTGETQAATLGIAYSDEPDTLLKRDNGLFTTADGTELPAGGQYSMQQGYLEDSNVDSARTMTDMLTAYRAFEANQKVLQAYDRSMEKAVNEVGRVN
ncbi:flagellar hook-basal body protein [Sporosarcina sp. PTS2304]|uniref:flagellar hook-basal body protein n=1 Tax=Sporosarcina sp. PTS2304 TaxID=2283194 RepID=UPI000E0E01B9|nr:flagellar hook-basal body protein [Sporosarcina sp. PTS2304]AXI01158.1 flagellar hook-basal body protein [Sporosarcina sp. PTS2304]